MSKKLVGKQNVMKKLNEMSKGQLKYETKRAFKNGMTLEDWIAHKEKMMRKKMERKNLGSSNPFHSIPWISKPMGLPVDEDQNRVVICENLKSKFYNDNVEMGLNEEFIGGFKTLRNDPFFASVILDKGSMKKIEEDCINRNHYFHSTGDFSGIKHIAYWSKEYECFLAWRLVPEGLNMMGLVA